MIPTTPNTRLDPPVSEPVSRQVRALGMTVSLRAVQSKNAATSQLEREKAWDARQQKLSCMPLKVVDSCTTRSPSHTRTWMHFWHVLCTNIITMTHDKLKHKLTIYRHYKNAYSDEKEFKRREKEREGNEERQRVKKKKKEWFNWCVYPVRIRPFLCKKIGIK